MNFEILNKQWSILAIDDSKLNRAIIKKNLGELNMLVDEASDGIEGLDALKKKNYDLVIVDNIMPNLDGFGFLSKFKDFIGDSFVPVILMTGSDDLNSKVKGLTIGADDFLLKPLNNKELVARVLSLLRLKNAHMELYEKNRQIQWELEAAKKVQQFIIPTSFSNITYPRVSGLYLPIEDIGGDYFDCYDINDDCTGFLIADVTGHGIPAALVMAMPKMIFSIYSTRYEKPAELLKTVNTKIKSVLLDGQYITCFYMVYNNREHTLYYCNAGHTRALLHRARDGSIIALDTRGYFIGITTDADYEEKSILVEKGDRVFVYTDGLSEIKNDKKEEFGEKRIASFIRKNSSLRGDDFCAGLYKNLERFAAVDERNDDLAFLNIEF
jgi:serine phosphatase RsbU (regulator of sigma subunit)